PAGRRPGGRPGGSRVPAAPGGPRPGVDAGGVPAGYLEGVLGTVRERPSGGGGGGGTGDHRQRGLPREIARPPPAAPRTGRAAGLSRPPLRKKTGRQAGGG